MPTTLHKFEFNCPIDNLPEGKLRIKWTKKVFGERSIKDRTGVWNIVLIARSRPSLVYSFKNKEDLFYFCMVWK